MAFLFVATATSLTVLPIAAERLSWRSARRLALPVMLYSLVVTAGLLGLLLG